MITTKTYLRIVRTSAWYDLITTAGFSNPLTFTLVLAGLQQLSNAMGFTDVFPKFDTAHMLMVNMLGSVIIVWSVLRVRFATVLLGRHDVLARVLFSFSQAYALSQGGPAIIWGFLFFEVLFGIAQALPVQDAAKQAA